MIKQNELDLANTDFKMEVTKSVSFNVAFVFVTLQLHLSLEPVGLISMGSVVNVRSFANDVFNQLEKQE